MIDNPKSTPADSTEKDPQDWVSGDEPMTGAQASYLKTLAEQLHEPEALAGDLTKAEASKRIDALKGATSRSTPRPTADIDPWQSALYIAAYETPASHLCR